MQTIAERIETLYEDFFRLAERRRRWNIEEDVPWGELDPSTFDARRAAVAETYCAVEMYVPDYIGEGIALVRECFGQAWFQINWAYEESKHALCLREYLLRSGQRSRQDFRALQASLFEKRWRAPYDTARQMIAYGLIQEMTAVISYRTELGLALRRDDKVLAKIYQLIARDEAAHAAFYLDVYRAFMAEDRVGSMSDLLCVFRGFRMPGADLIPDYGRRMTDVRDGGFSRESFLDDVWFPLLRRLGVSRRELVAASSSHRVPT